MKQVQITTPCLENTWVINKEARSNEVSVPANGWSHLQMIEACISLQTAMNQIFSSFLYYQIVTIFILLLGVFPVWWSKPVSFQNTGFKHFTTHSPTQITQKNHINGQDSMLWMEIVPQEDTLGHKIHPNNSRIAQDNVTTSYYHL